MKLKFLTLFSILALAASVFAESAMSNITVNLRYTGKNGTAKKLMRGKARQPSTCTTLRP